MTTRHISVDGGGAIRRLTLNRPTRHNAQTPLMWAELAEAGAELAADPQVRCVVVSGTGKSFSSGIGLVSRCADRTAFSSGSPPIPKATPTRCCRPSPRPRRRSAGWSGLRSS